MAMRVTLAHQKETMMRALTTRVSGGHTATQAYARELEPRAGAWRSLCTRFVTYLRKLSDERRARRGWGDLGSMSDRDLRDIGLRRTDVEMALLWERPSLDPVRFERV
jgi:uncharacterized protein YjiS (DUF1127 family)